MIDKNDSLTQDAFPIKLRGRPRTGRAMTDAQRKRNQRRRALNEIRDAMAGKRSFDSVSLTALMTELAAAVRHGYPDTVRAISEELVKRANGNQSRPLQ
jgi:hypothetical protein